MKLTARYFTNGYQAFEERENGNSKRLYMSEGIYHFVYRRTGWQGVFIWQSFETFKEAVKEWRSIRI